MSNICLYNPNEVKIQKGNKINDCVIENNVSIVQNLFNYNNLSKNDLMSRFPYPGVLPNGPATNSWPCRNQKDCNYFDTNNPIIPEYIRKIDLESLPPN
tara:strand:+ start:88 stop:384 length:297 start_codon:yes stop_codon:yes gene_type:complete